MTGAALSATAPAIEAVEIVSAELDLSPEATLELSRLLSGAEAQRAARFFRERDRRRFIAARGRLRQLLAARLGMVPESIAFTYGAQGKPALGPELAACGLHFNVSHSEGLAVYAFAHGAEVGVDVEAVRVLRDADDIARRFFSPRETEAYLALDPRQRPRGFFNCWTRKEAFIKALGEGLSHPLDSFDVTLAPGEPARLLRVGDAPGARSGWALRSFTPRQDFVAAVVCREAAA